MSQLDDQIPPQSTPPSKIKILGRGLDSLFGSSPNMSDSLEKKEGLSLLPLTVLRPGSYQPRSNFTEKEMSELTNSIIENGVLQPILVRPTGEMDKFNNPHYEIIAGERRWRASKEAGRKTIPVVIKHLTDKQALETGLIENIQRHDLNPLEEALGYARLISDFKYTQDLLSKKLGKSRSHIANMLRLLTLSPVIKSYIESRHLSVGHARALIGCEKSEELACLILKEGLNVRQTERLVAEYNKKPFDLSDLPASFQTQKEPLLSSQKGERSQHGKTIQNEDITSLEKELSKALDMKSNIVFKSDQSGHVQINFKTPQELDHLMNIIFGTL